MIMYIKTVTLKNDAYCEITNFKIETTFLKSKILDIMDHSVCDQLLPISEKKSEKVFDNIAEKMFFK